MSDEMGGDRETTQTTRDDRDRGNTSMPNYLSGFLALLVVAGVAFGYIQWKSRRRLEIAVENRYTQAFFDLVSNVDNVQVALAKSLASGSPRLRVGALSDVWKQAGDAQANLNSLPVSQGILMRTSAFLTQVGDFAFITARKVANQQMMSDEDWARLAEMKKQARELGDGLAELQAGAAGGNIRWVQVAQKAQARVSSGSKGGSDIATDGLTRVDEQVQHFPTLIYDGPFSDHVQQREAVGITGPDVGPEEATAIAKRALPFDMSGYTATVEEEISGKIPTYRVRLKAPAKSGKPDAVVDVCRKGGKVAMMNIARDIGEQRLDLKQAVSHAEKFLVQSGYQQMQPTFASEVGGAAVIPFVAVQQGALIYPDMVKVKVGLDTGEILSMDATGYLMSHHTRTIPKPKISAAEAAELLSPALEPAGEPRLAVIPIETVDTPEAVCWEFKGTSFGDDFYVYINVEDGREESILQLIPTSEGTLAL
jgi:spore germination protein